MSAATTHLPVDYVGSARRHITDAKILMNAGRQANAGQLLGFSVECGLKALLVACGAETDGDGGVSFGSKLREHLPKLNTKIVSMGYLVPDGQRPTHYLAMLPSAGELSGWKVEHRYFRESALPLTALPQWMLAAQEINEMLDQAEIDGVI